MSNMTVVSTGPRRERLTVDFSDGTGTIQLVWFAGTKWVRSKLKPGVKYTVIGKPSFYNGQWQMTHPELETELRPSTSDTQSPTSDIRPPFLPVYNTTDKMKQHGLGTRALARLTETLCNCITSVDETLPQEVLDRFHLMPRLQALKAIHYPENQIQLDAARARLKFEELFFLQLDYQYAHYARCNRSHGLVFSSVGDYFNRFYAQLPFPTPRPACQAP